MAPKGATNEEWVWTNISCFDDQNVIYMVCLAIMKATNTSVLQIGLVYHYIGSTTPVTNLDVDKNIVIFMLL